MKIKQILIMITLAIGLMSFCVNLTVFAADCGTYKTSILPCSEVKVEEKVPIENTPLFKNLLLFINVLTGGIGVFAVGGVVYGAILYMTAGSSTEQTKKAIVAIRNVVIGIIAYGLAWSFLNFIIPGGLF